MKTNNSDKHQGDADFMSSLPGISSGEKEREESKREKMFNPAQRWKAIQEMIAWAEQNMPPHLRRNRPRTHPANDQVKKNET